MLIRSLFHSRYKVAGVGLALLLLGSVVHAQSNTNIEDLEKRLEEQRMALEEAIANREETAEKAKEVADALEESEERRAEVEEELKTLCEEQEGLNPGTFDECMENPDS